MKLAELYVEIRARLNRFFAALGQAHTALAKLRTSMIAMGATATRAFLVVAAAVGLAVVPFMQFEQKMARVKALSGATGKDFDALRVKALELGRTTVFSATQSADAMSYFALQGFKAREIIGAMPATLNLAAAGQIGLAEAADIAGKIMKVMGHTAAELTGDVDILTRAFTTSNSDLSMLGESFKYVGPVMKALRMDLTQGIPLLQALHDKGIQASQAGTTLRTVLSRMAGAGGQATAVFKRLGVELTTADGKLRPVPDIIDETNAAFARLGIGTTQQVALMSKAFGQRMFGGFLALLSTGGEKLRVFEKDLRAAGGTAERIAAIQLDTLQGKLILLKSAAEGAAIALGESFKGFIQGLAESLTEIANAISGMTPQMKIFASTTAIAMLKILALAKAISLLAAHPMLALAAGLAAAIMYWQSLGPEIEDVTDALAKEREELRARQATDREMLSRLDELTKKQKRTNAEQEEADRIAKRLTATYGALGIQLDAQGRAVAVLAGAYDQLSKAQRAELVGALQQQMARAVAMEQDAIAQIKFWRSKSEDVWAQLAEKFGGTIHQQTQHGYQMLSKAVHAQEDIQKQIDKLEAGGPLEDEKLQEQPEVIGTGGAEGPKLKTWDMRGIFGEMQRRATEGDPSLAFVRQTADSTKATARNTLKMGDVLMSIAKTLGSQSLGVFAE